jgi:rod shape-determining protein MreD
MKLRLKKSNGLDFIPHRYSKAKKVAYTTLQVVLCAVLISIAFIVSCGGFYVKPMLLLPIAICLAVFSEDELKSSLIGVVCGLLIDISCNKLLGFNGAILLVMCVFTTLMFKNYFKPMFFNALVYVGIFTFIQGFLDYFFYYKIWALNSQNDVSLILTNYTYPSCIMTIASVLVIYPIIKSIRIKLTPVANGL